MDEFRYQDYESAALNDGRTKQYHDKKILKREFYKGDLVLLFNSRMKLPPGKLKLRLSDPFEVVIVPAPTPPSSSHSDEEGSSASGFSDGIEEEGSEAASGDASPASQP
ncbi:uncharacterized protein LOC132639345 [Lycium barbarum]|uniref:uncharacterized protein LOC132639345 n=1 Tax=Lycium barbarum TaxID=112863 RepID=UPI00293E4072|nr:uncharacterized protein LOC132639345 [Lycium barbarum]